MPRGQHDPTTAARLATLLLPYRTGGLGHEENDFRFHDAPVDVAAAAFGLVDDWFLETRPNDQPPAAWILDAARRLDGKVAGHVSTWRQALRVDAVCVPVTAGARLVAEVRAQWPDAADLALVQLWESWEARQALVEKTVADLAAEDLARPDAEVLGLWWD